MQLAGTVGISPKAPPPCRCERPRFARQADDADLGCRCLTCGKRPAATAALTVLRFASQ
ncbi:MAG TPA: hypothetical protein VLK89_01400 [Solirubrobacterales bacterium]|nr:hypothetical protein [Solirubrobacterales bacterium]